MAQRIFSLHDVPVDEAEDIFALLDDAQIAWYQTAPSVWGLSTPAIYVYQASDVAAARTLIDEYQRERSVRLRESGVTPARGAAALLRSLLSDWLNKPVRMTALLVIVGLVLYFSIKPFMLFL